MKKTSAKHSTPRPIGRDWGKVFLLSLLMLCSMTVAWAGEGDGSKEKPYTGYWNANVLFSQLKEGDHLAYNCRIVGDYYGKICVYDDRLDNVNVYKNFEWTVGDLIGSNEPLPEYYKYYYSSNSPEDRKNHTFIVTKAEIPAGTTINITGHYSGSYGGGDGSKEHPFTGVWTGSEIGPRLEPGMYLAFDCVIKDVNITVFDSKLWQTVAQQWTAWSPGNLIENAKDGPYKHYCEDNTPEDRRRHSFILTEVSPSAKTSSDFTITGYFSGLYVPEGFVRVASAEQMWNVLQKDGHAKIILMQDIYLSKIGRDSEPLCSTFYGILDGNGHTIYGANYGDNSEKRRRSRTYLFKYTEGATIKNLTIKDIMINLEKKTTIDVMINGEDYYSQAIITAVSRNDCVFENITFDNCSVWSCHNDRVGAAAGSAYSSTFNNIKVMNSGFIANYSVGAVVGYVGNTCTFTNIDVINCQTYALGDNGGGVAGYANRSNFTDVTIHSGHYKADGIYAGGVVGWSDGASTFTHCVTKDQVSVWADGTGGGAAVGGIVGRAVGGCSFLNCINSAIVSADGGGVGGIVGNSLTSEEYPERPIIKGCLNTGLIVSQVAESDVPDLCDKYKTKQMTCVTKNYNGIEYTIRSYKKDEGLIPPIVNWIIYYLGGIGGSCIDTDISQCANIGVICSYWTKCVGGIAGQAKTSNITDCLVDAEINKANDTQVSAIASRVYLENKPLSISNCLAFVKPSYSDHDECIYIDAAGDTIDVDKSDVPYGMYCYKLGDNWEQNIGTDPYPTPTSTSKRGLYHTRNISNEYGTICLPFKAVSDENISFFTLQAYAINKNHETIMLFFEKAETLEAGTPALFRAKSDSIALMDAKDGYASTPKVWAEAHNTWSMEGTFEQKVFADNAAKSIYYVSGGAIKNAKKTTIAPFRAFFHGPEMVEEDPSTGGYGAKSIQFVLEDEDGYATALELIGNNLKPVQQNSKTYSIMGTEVGNGYKGIVIKNGKKYVAK